MKNSRSVTIIKPPSNTNHWKEGILPVDLVSLFSVLSESFCIKLSDLEIKIWDNNLDNESPIDLSLFSVKNVLEYCSKDGCIQISETINKILELFNTDATTIVFYIKYNSQFLSALALAKALKKKNKTIIFMGGYFKNIHARIRKTHDFIDYIIPETLASNLNQLLQKISINETPNLNWQQKGDNSINISQNDTISSKINFPDEDCFNHQISCYKKYLELYFGLDKLVFSYQISDGCVNNNCFFCGANKHQKFSFKDPSQVLSDLIDMSQHYKSNLFTFADSSFIFSNTYAKNICRAIISKKLNFQFFGLCLYEHLDEDLIRLLKEAGCLGLSFGIESLSLKDNYSLRKNKNLKKLPRILKLCKENNIWIHPLFITGFPYQDLSAIKEDIAFIKNNKENIPSILVQKFQLHMNSNIYMNPEKYGIHSIDYKIAPYVRDIPFYPRQRYDKTYVDIFKDAMVKLDLLIFDPNYLTFLFNPSLRKAISTDPDRFYSTGSETFLEKCKDYIRNER